MKRILSAVIAIMIAVTFAPGLGTGQVHAATKKPAKITGVTYQIKGTKATVKWKAVKGAKKYEVQVKSPFASWVKCKKVKDTKANRKKYSNKQRFKIVDKGKTLQIYHKKVVFKSNFSKKNIFVIKKFDKGYSYKVRVRAINGKKKGKFSKIVVVKVTPKKKNDIPGTEQKVKVTSIGIGGTSFREFNETVLAGRKATKFYAWTMPADALEKVTWKVEGATGLSYTTTDNSISISAPKSHEEGRFKLTATAVDGSKVSKTITVPIVNEYKGARQKVRFCEVKNVLPVNDFSYPQFASIPQSSVKEILDFEYGHKTQKVYVHLDMDDDIYEDVCIYNATTGEDMGKIGASIKPGGNMPYGFDHYSLADVDYVSPSDRDAKLKRGGRLVPIVISKDSVVAGENRIQFRPLDLYAEQDDDPPIYGEFILNVNSRADDYTAFADRMINESENYIERDNCFYLDEAADITKNQELFYKLYCAQEYIQHVNEYPPSYAGTVWGNIVIMRLAKQGQTIYSKEGGCEDGAVMMTIVAQRMGVDAKYKVVSSNGGGIHVICEIKNSKQLFGVDGVTFDATPHSTRYSGFTSESRYWEFINSLTKIL